MKLVVSIIIFQTSKIKKNSMRFYMQKPNRTLLITNREKFVKFKKTTYSIVLSLTALGYLSFYTRYMFLKDSTYFILILQIATLLYQYTGMDGIKGPVMYVVYDLLLWGLIGQYMFSTRKKNNRIFSIALIFFFSIFLNIRGLNMVTIGPSTNTFNIDVTPLFREDFKRSEYVDATNMAKLENCSSDVTDAYSALLGANVKFSKENKMFMNYDFIAKLPLTE